MESIIDEVVDAVGEFVDGEYASFLASRSLDKTRAAATVASLQELGFASAAAADEFRGNELTVSTAILAAVAERWGSLAWSLIPGMISQLLDPDAVRRSVGVCFPAGAPEAPIASGERWEGRLRYVLDPAAESLLVFPAELSAASGVVLRLDVQDARVEPAALDGLRHAEHGTVDVSAAEVTELPRDGSYAVRIMMAAVSVGLARGALRLGSGYARDRWQFGSPIGSYGEVRAIVGLAARRVAVAGASLERAAALYDSGARDELFAAMLLAETAESAYLVAERMQHVHGGYGQMKEFEIGAFVRDARIIGSFDSSPEVLDDAIASRRGLAEGG